MFHFFMRVSVFCGKGICSMSIKKNVALNIREREKLSRTRTEYGSEVKAYWGYCAGKV